MQTADCRLQTADRAQNADQAQNADRRLQTGHKTQTDTRNCSFRGFLTFYNLPAVTQSPFRCHTPRKLASPGNDLAPLLEIYFSNEVSKINSFLNMI